MAEPIRDYRDLVAWQRAIDFAVSISRVCDRLPRREWALASQMRRAANSVHANIAEGNGRGSLSDYLRHLFMSRSSLNELESHLYFVDRCYGERMQAQNALDFAITVRKPLFGLIASIEKKRDEEG